MRRAPAGALLLQVRIWSRQPGELRGRAARSRLRRRRGGRRGGVLELLLGTEQGVQDLLAQALGEREGDTAADEAEQQYPAEAAASLLLGRLVEGDTGVAEVLRRLLDVLLELPVLEDLLRGRLAVAQALERVTAGRIGLQDVLSQVLVVHDTLDVGVVPRLQGRLLGLGGLLLRCHTTLSRCQVPGLASSIPRITARRARRRRPRRSHPPTRTPCRRAGAAGSPRRPARCGAARARGAPQPAARPAPSPSGRRSAARAPRASARPSSRCRRGHGAPSRATS